MVIDDLEKIHTYQNIPFNLNERKKLQNIVREFWKLCNSQKIKSFVKFKSYKSDTKNFPSLKL